MSDLIHISRSFVEFGPFSKKEILDFNKRGLLQEIDYLRTEPTDSWTPSGAWLAENDKPAAAPKAKAPAKPKSTAKPAAKKAAPKLEVVKKTA